MTQANDIAGLFKKLGTSPELYQELVRQNEVQKSRERWPLLSAIQANEPAPPPVEIRREAIRQAPPQAAAQPQQMAYAPAAPDPYEANFQTYPPSMQYAPAAPQPPQPQFAQQPPVAPVPQGFAPQPYTPPSQPFPQPGVGDAAAYPYPAQQAPAAAHPFLAQQPNAPYPHVPQPQVHQPQVPQPQVHQPQMPQPHMPAAQPYVSPAPAALAQPYAPAAPAPVAQPHYPEAPPPQHRQPAVAPHPGAVHHAGPVPASAPPVMASAPAAAAPAAAPAPGAFYQAPAPQDPPAGGATQLTSLFDRLARPEAPAPQAAAPRKQSIFERLIR